MLAPLMICDYQKNAVAVLVSIELFGAVFLFSFGAAIVNLVRRLEQRLVTRAEENEKLINKMQHGLLIITDG